MINISDLIRKRSLLQPHKKALIFEDLPFTPLENPGIYAEDRINRKHQLIIGNWVKALPFLTGSTYQEIIEKLPKTASVKIQEFLLKEWHHAKVKIFDC